MTVQKWATVEAFYADRPERATSGELDFGCHWTDNPEQHWPRHRVSLVIATGEIYETDLTRGTVTLIGVVAGDTDDEIRGHAERILEGWARQCRPGGIQWIYDRMREAGALT